MIVGALLLAGCIPQQAEHGGYDAPPPAPQRPDPYRPSPYRPSPYPPSSRQPKYPEPRPIDNKVSALPAPRPAWEAKPVAPDATLVPDGSYTVRPGDTLRTVGNQTGAGSEVIARANNLEPPFVIRAGQRLRIPGGRYHLVLAGQTGIAIARAYGVEWSKIVTANALEEPYVLRVGQRVLIPTSGAPRTAAERAAAFSLDIDDILTGGEPALVQTAKPAKPVATAKRILPPTAQVAAPPRLTGGFGWPVTGRIVKRFGPGGSGERNDGIKIAVPLDTPILATADGVVAYVGNGVAALGGLVIVKHGNGYTSVYGHASQLLVQRGQAVKKGQTIAMSGDSGFADRPELHFEIRKGRTPVDPLGQLPSR